MAKESKSVESNDIIENEGSIVDSSSKVKPTNPKTELNQVVSYGNLLQEFEKSQLKKELPEIYPQFEKMEFLICGDGELFDEITQPLHEFSNVTLNRGWKGTDHSFALEPQGFRKFVRDIKRVRYMLPSKDKIDLLKKTYGEDHYFYSLDLQDDLSIEKCMLDVSNNHKDLSVIINNAGTIRRNAAENHPTEWWDEVIEVNLSSQFLLSREIGREMINRGSGKIIFIASLLTFQGGITVPGYAASKGGIGQLTKALANEWASKGINVNAIAPGYIATDNTEALRNDEVRYKAILERIPQGRWGTPEDFAGPSIFLASDASNYVNGEILTVDGGWMGR